MAFTNPFDMRRFGQILDPAPQSPLLKAYRGVSFGGTDLGDTSPSAAPTSQQAREVEDPVLAALSKLQTGSSYLMRIVRIFHSFLKPGIMRRAERVGLVRL